MSDEQIKVASFGIKNGSYRQIAMQDFVDLFALHFFERLHFDLEFSH